MKKLKAILIIFFIFLVGLNFLMSVLGIAVGIVNYVDIHFYYVKSGGSKNINGIWIQPLINEKNRSISFFPIFGYRYIGSPYKVGLRALDENNKHLCTKMEILELSLSKDNSILQLIAPNASPVSTKFEKYLSNIDHVDAKWLADVGDWLGAKGKQVVVVKVQDIDDPSLTVKMFKTSMTPLNFVAVFAWHGTSKKIMLGENGPTNCSSEPRMNFLRHQCQGFIGKW